MSNGEIVDVHSHLYPRWYLDLLAERSEPPLVSRADGSERLVLFADEAAAGASGGRPIGEDFWALDRKHAFMDRFGITRSVLSLGNPWLDVFEPQTARELAWRVNEEFADIAARSGGRLSAVGVLPSGLDDAAEAIAQLARLDLRGIVIGTRPFGRLLDDPALEPLWHEAERRGLPVFVHPHYGLGTNEMRGLGHAGPVALAFTFETTLAAMRLAAGGVLARHPELTVVLSHGGGALPFLIGRLDAAWRSDPSLHEGLPYAPSDDLSRVVLDAVLFEPMALRAAAELVGAARLPFGTDHPFSIADPRQTLDAVAEAFDGDERAQVLAGAAVALFRLGPSAG